MDAAAAQALLDRIQQLEQMMQQAQAAVASADGRASAAESAAIALGAQYATMQGTGLPRAPAASQPTYASSMVDTRSLGRPKSFDGKDSSWRSYRFGITAYAGAIDPVMAQLMNAAPAQLETEVTNTSLQEDHVRRSTQLYYMLALSIDADTGALSIIERAGPTEGLLAWWRLVQMFEPDVAGRSTALLQEVLNHKFVGDARASFEEFDLKVRRYEAAAGEKMTDKIKIGLVYRAAEDTDLKRHLLFQAHRLTTYDQVREEVRTIAAARFAAAGPSVDPSAMDIGKVGADKGGKKGKGKGETSGKGKSNKGTGKYGEKGKGKSKDKSGPDYSNVLCHYCGKMGHIKRDCRKKLRDDEGRGSVNQVQSGAASSVGPSASRAPPGPASTINTVAASPEWLLAVSSEENKQAKVETIGMIDRILVDSGCMRSVCPAAFAPEYREPDSRYQFRTADGTVLEHHGSAEVKFKSGGSMLGVHFEVTDVQQPMLSVAAAVDQGNDVVFTRRGGYIVSSEGGLADRCAQLKHIEVAREGNAYYLVGERVESLAVCPVGTEELDDDPRDGTEAGPSQASSSSRPGSRANPEGGAVEPIRPEKEPEAKARRVPREPTEAEVERHVLTHLPYRDWCEACVRGKAKENPHRRGREPGDLDEVQIDYLFMQNQLYSDEPMLTILTVLYVETGAICCTMAVKGESPYMIRYLTNALDSWGLGDVRLKSDQEPGIIALAKAVRDERHPKKTVLMNSAAYSHASQGPVERANQSLAAQIRTFRVALQGHLGARLPADHPMMPWIIRHAGWTWTRFTTRPCGRTPAELTFGRAFHGELVELGERIFGRRGGANTGQKLDGRWISGIWVGQTETSGEQLISTPEVGIVRVRSVRRRPASERWNQQELTTLRGAPWDLKQKAEASVIDGALADTNRAVVEPNQSPPPMITESDARLPTQRSTYITKAMLARYGTTLGCPRCTTGEGMHSQQCRARIEEAASAAAGQPIAAPAVETPVLMPSVQPADEGQEAPDSLMQEAPEPDPGTTAGSKMEVNSCILEPLGGDLAEEFCDEFGPDPYLNEEAPEVEEGDLVGTSKPYDQRTGEPLDRAMAQEGRAAELKKMRELEVFEVKPVGELRGKKVDTKWVEEVRARPDGTMFVRSRLVAREMAWGARDDVNAGTPPLAAVRLLLSLAACQRRNGRRSQRSIALHDAEVAFFHATLDEWICIARPPPGTAPAGQGWQLKKALYGTRRAAQLWAEYLFEVYSKGGWIRSRVVPNFYFKLDPPAASVVHGDDFATEGDDNQQDEFDELLRQNVKVKMLGRIGQGHQARGRFLKRWIEWRGDRFVYYSDPKHAETVIRMMNMQGANGIDTPGSKATGRSAEGADEPLARELASEVSCIVGTILYLAQDRPDIQYCSRVLSSDISCPKKVTYVRLKRVARYFQQHPNVEWHFPVKDIEPGEVIGYSDSDWAADETTRKSASGTAIFHSGHLIETACVGQGTIALSSAEAEFYALGRLAAGVLLIANLLDEMELKKGVPILKMDSDAGRALATRLGAGRQRHIHTRYLWIQEKVRRAELLVRRVPGEENFADLMTKHLDANRMSYLMSLAGLRRTNRRQLASVLAAALCPTAVGTEVGAYVGRTDHTISVEPMAMLKLVVAIWLWGFLVGVLVGWLAGGRNRKVEPPSKAAQPTTTTTRMTTATTTPTTMAATATPATTTESILYELTCEELRGLLRNRRRPTTGLKRDLVARLAEPARTFE